MAQPPVFAFLFAAALAPVVAQEPSPPARRPGGTTAPQSAAAERASFRLPEGFRAELVAAEPLVREPVMCTFDADGRLYVAEMTTYMQDIDGSAEDEPTGRISVLFDDDGDGRMDRRTTFADGLVLPRLLLPLDDAVLVGETYTTALWLYRDADRDGVAESKECLREGKRDGRNLEHQDSALTWGIDNWLYTAMSGERLRLRDGKLTSESVSSEFAQWGLGVDDLGRQFFASAGGERPAYGFQRHPRYGRASFDGELAPDFVAVFPAIATPDVQGGEGRLRADGTLNHFTGCCGQSIYRGDALPADCVGDYFVCEPVGRLVRRAQVRDVAAKLVLSNRYPDGEFLTSTDMNFRPVWSTTGPDGALWLVDMYRGIIQEGNWVRDGSYLRPVVARLGLDKNVGRGRIWRIVGAAAPAAPPARLRAAVDDLLADLAHPNGWRRDNAQKLLVRRGDRAAVPGLRRLVRQGGPTLAQVHALWTLEGLDALAGDDLAAALGDADPRVRCAAVRASEASLARGDAAALAQVTALARDADLQVAVQVALSLRFASEPAAKDAILAVLGQHQDNEVVAAACRDSMRGEQGEAGGAGLDAPGLALVQEGKTHFLQLCVACHGADGRGVKAAGVELGAPLLGSPRVRGSAAALARIVLHGLTGPIDGKVWGAGVMAPQSAQDDRYVAAVLSYVRTMFGEFAGVVTPEQVAAVRKQCAGRAAMWTFAELAEFFELPRATVAGFKASASHGGDSAAAALDGDAGSRFTTGTPMQKDMWWQVDFDADYQLTELVIDAGASAQDFPRGYRVEVSSDGAAWRAVAQGEAAQACLVVPLSVARARSLRVVQTGTSDKWYWSIHAARFSGRRLD